jgi:hypothetical protein
MWTLVGAGDSQADSLEIMTQYMGGGHNARVCDKDAGAYIQYTNVTYLRWNTVQQSCWQVQRMNVQGQM